MRNQLINICTLKKRNAENFKLHYEAGSIETLINLVDNSDGITIIPRLSTLKMYPSQKKKLFEFASPKPAREISLISSSHFPRKQLLKHLKEIIIESVSKYGNMDKKGRKVVEINVGTVNGE